MNENKKNKKPTEVIFKVIYYIVIVALLGVALLLVGTRFPIPGNLQVYVVRSGSMEPSIPTGAVVVVRRATEYNENEVITFSNRGEDIPTTHRIIKKEIISGRASYTTKGDANNAPDVEAVYSSRILGKVLFDIPYVGYAVAAARQPLGFFIIIVLPALFIIYDEGMNIWKELKHKKNKETAANEKSE